MALTRGHLLRHFQGKTGGFYPAMLDVAQDHVLHHLHREGLFELGLVFKGGTSLRKMRSGAAGRFSTDLDFCAPAEGLATLVMDTIDRVTVPPFTFVITERDDDAGRADLRVTAPFGPGPADNAPSEIRIASKVEFSPRTPWLEPETLPFLALPVHRSYDLPGRLPALPVVRVEEAIAEKLARYARVGLARDLYDLVWYGRQGVLDEVLIRRLWVLKVYQDVVVDGRWSSRSFNPAAILTPRAPGEIDDENIGYLTQPIDVAGWEGEFRQRYGFLTDLTHEDSTWTSCNAGRRYDFAQAVLGF
jgi:predicted nucleotidyltransferase component of viral defense system